jgi:hypothetical protein
MISGMTLGTKELVVLSRGANTRPAFDIEQAQ